MHAIKSGVPLFLTTQCTLWWHNVHYGCVWHLIL